jgi:hypothetical protein
LLEKGAVGQQLGGSQADLLALVQGVEALFLLLLLLRMLFLGGDELLGDVRQLALQPFFNLLFIAQHSAESKWGFTCHLRCLMCSATTCRTGGGYEPR